MVPWERLLILRHTMPKTQHSTQFLGKGTPQSTLQHPQKILGQVTLPLWIVTMAITAHYPAHSHLGALPYSPMRNYWPLSPISLSFLPPFHSIYQPEHLILPVYPQSPRLWSTPWIRVHSLQTLPRSCSPSHSLSICPASAESLAPSLNL